LYLCNNFVQQNHLSDYFPVKISFFQALRRASPLISGMAVYTWCCSRHRQVWLQAYYRYSSGDVAQVNPPRTQDNSFRPGLPTHPKDIPRSSGRNPVEVLRSMPASTLIIIDQADQDAGQIHPFFFTHGPTRLYASLPRNALRPSRRPALKAGIHRNPDIREFSGPQGENGSRRLTTGNDLTPAHAWISGQTIPAAAAEKRLPGQARRIIHKTNAPGSPRIDFFYQVAISASVDLRAASRVVLPAKFTVEKNDAPGSPRIDFLYHGSEVPRAIFTITGRKYERGCFVSYLPLTKTYKMRVWGKSIMSRAPRGH